MVWVDRIQSRTGSGRRKRPDSGGTTQCRSFGRWVRMPNVRRFENSHREKKRRWARFFRLMAFR